MTLRKGTPEWKEANLELCKEEIRAIVGNPFFENLKEIQAICYERGVDIGVGLDMWISEHPEVRKVPDKAIAEKLEEYATIEEAADAVFVEWVKEYRELCRKYYLDFIIEVQEVMKTEPVPFEETAEVIEQ